MTRLQLLTAGLGLALARPTESELRAAARAYLEHCPSWPRPSREQYEQAGTLDLHPGAVRAWRLERRLRDAAR